MYIPSGSWKLPVRFRMVSSCGIIQRVRMVSVLGFLTVSVVAGNVSLWFPSVVSLWFPSSQETICFMVSVVAGQFRI